MELIRRISFGKDRFHEQDAMIEWCKQHCGEGGYHAFTKREDARWSVDRMFGHAHFFFKEEKDVVLFSMKWL
jgi:hypothetical protein